MASRTERLLPAAERFYATLSTVQRRELDRVIDRLCEDVWADGHSEPVSIPPGIFVLYDDDRWILWIHETNARLITIYNIGWAGLPVTFRG